MQKLAEARIIMAFEPEMERTNEVRRWLEDELLDTFGGWTRIIGRGSWRNAKGLEVGDIIYVYDVAMDPHDFPKLKSIAVGLARLAEQEAVYVRDTDGEVHFVQG